MNSLLADFRHTHRVLRASPGLVLVSVLSLGLGIGVNLTLFGWVRSALFYQPDIIDPARVVGIQPGNSNQFSYLNYVDLRDSGTFAALAGFRELPFNIGSGERLERFSGLAVTADFFEFVGVTPALGRTFTAGEAAPERDPRIAVISYGLWQQRYGGDIRVLGTTTTVNGAPFEIVGVLPSGYRPVTARMEPALYVPISRFVLPTIDDRSNANALNVLGRLRPGVSREQAGAAVTLLGQRLARAYPGDNAGMDGPAVVVPLRIREFGGWREPLMLSGVLFLLVGLVLLSACANVAGLLLARTGHRRREIAVRAALGARRVRLIRMLLLESVSLAALGAVAGTLLFLWLTAALQNIVLPAVLGPVPLHLEFDTEVVAYALALTLATGVVSGLFPAWHATRRDLAAAIQHGGTHTTTRRLSPRHAFVVAQVAASVILLVLSSLLLRSLTLVTTLDPGFDVDRVALAIVNVDANRYAVDGGLPLAERLAEQVQALPGVESASFAGIVALGWERSAALVQAEGVPPGPGVRTYVNSVGPRYFETLGIPFVAGRDFDRNDRAGAPPVAIVNEALAHAYFPNQDALGKRMRRSEREPYAEIVGIVRDTKYGSIAEAPTPIFYAAYAQAPQISTQLRPVVVHVRTAGAPASVLPALRRAAAAVDPTAYVQAQTLREATGGEADLRLFGTRALGAIGGVAVLLASIGLYGMIAFVVSSRTREIGMRMALGASAGRILAAFMAQGLRMVATGIAIGGVGAWMAASALVAVLAGISPADPMAYATSIPVLVVTAFAAIYIPARRAAALDPVEALRAD